MVETFVAVMLEDNRFTMPKEIAEILKIHKKKGIKVKFSVEKVYK